MEEVPSAPDPLDGANKLRLQLRGRSVLEEGCQGRDCIPQLRGCSRDGPRLDVVVPKELSRVVLRNSVASLSQET